MNWLDIVLIVLLGLSTVQSFRKGFSREVTGLAASLLALVLAMWFYGIAGSYIQPYVASSYTANLIGFVLVVLCVVLLGSFTGFILSHFIRTIGLSFFDRFLGACFGFARGALIAVALLTATIAFTPGRGRDSVPESVLNSQIAVYLLDASRYFIAIAPMDLKLSFRSHYEDVKAGIAKRKSEKGSGK